MAGCGYVGWWKASRTAGISTTWQGDGRDACQASTRSSTCDITCRTDEHEVSADACEYHHASKLASSAVMPSTEAPEPCSRWICWVAAVLARRGRRTHLCLEQLLEGDVNHASSNERLLNIHKRTQQHLHPAHGSADGTAGVCCNHIQHCC